MSLGAAALWALALIAAAVAWLAIRIAVDNYRLRRRPHPVGHCEWCREQVIAYLDNGGAPLGIANALHYPPGTFSYVCVTGAPAPGGVCSEHGETACVIGHEEPDRRRGRHRSRLFRPRG